MKRKLSRQVCYRELWQAFLNEKILYNKNRLCLQENWKNGKLKVTMAKESCTIHCLGRDNVLSQTELEPLWKLWIVAWVTVQSGRNDCTNCT